MLYLLDANVLMTANHSYYPVDRVPEYWAWLRHMGLLGKIKIPVEIFEEVKDGPKDGEKDLLFAWLQDGSNSKALLLLEDVDVGAVQKVVSAGYADDLTDDQIGQIGHDPFLIAYAYANPHRAVVTVEASKPSKIRQNRHVPDVCKSLNVRCCDPFTMARMLGFRTNWQHLSPVSATAA
jgi:hypothetical protein